MRRQTSYAVGVAVLGKLALLAGFGVGSTSAAPGPAAYQWEKTDMRSGEVADIVISPTNPNVMYAGIEVNAHALYKSTNAGASWTRIPGPGDHAKDVAVSPKDPSKAYVAMSESVHTTDLAITPTERSMFDRGPGGTFPGQATQTVLSSGLFPGPSFASFSTFEIFEQDDRIMYAAVRGGGFGPIGIVRAKLWQTTDGGQTWEKIESSIDQINVIEIHPSDSRHIFFGAGDGVYESTDAGRTMRRLKGVSDVISLEVQLDNPRVLYAATPKSVHKSADGGASWQEITGPLRDIHRVRVSRSQPNILYAATFDGVWRSDDAGGTWRDVDGPSDRGLKAKNVQALVIHPENPDVVFVGHSSLWSSARSERRWRRGLLAHQGIYKTTDGGTTWTRSDAGIEEYQFEEVAVNPGQPYEAWVASPASRGGYKTEDGGQSWRTAQLNTLHYPMRFKFSRQDPNVVYATSWHTGGPFARSSDGGVSWQMISEQAFTRGINRGQSLYEAGRGPGQIHLHALAVDPTNDQIIWTGSVEDAQNPGGFPLKGAHLFKSTDGGRSWTESDEGFPHERPTAIHDIAVDSTNPSVLYAATTEHEAREGIGIYKSTDAGRTWAEANNGLGRISVGAVVVHPRRPNELIAATGRGMFVSGNAGASWRQTASPPAFDVEYVKDDPEKAYASTGGGVLRTRDFGETWENVSNNLPAGHGQGIGVDPTGTIIYAAVADQGVFAARLAQIPPQNPASELAGEEFFSGAGASLSDDPPPLPFVAGALAAAAALAAAVILSVIFVRQRRWGRLVLTWVGFIVLIVLIAAVAAWLVFGPMIQLFLQQGGPSALSDIPAGESDRQQRH